MTIFDELRFLKFFFMLGKLLSNPDLLSSSLILHNRYIHKHSIQNTGHFATKLLEVFCFLSTNFVKHRLWGAANVFVIN